MCGVGNPYEEMWSQTSTERQHKCQAGALFDKND